jgi:hypothetical protein
MKKGSGIPFAVDYENSVSDRAPQARQIHSLGREPQVVGETKPRSPEGAADLGCGVSRSHDLLVVCRRFAAHEIFPDRVPGAHAPGYESSAASRLGRSVT